MVNVFKSLSECNTKPAALSLVSPYSDQYVPKYSLLQECPKPLPELYNLALFILKHGFDELLKVCESVDIT